MALAILIIVNADCTYTNSYGQNVICRDCTYVDSNGRYVTCPESKPQI